MDRRVIYDLLCRVISEAELGKKECIRDDFEEWRLCDHAWENLQELVEKIGEVITAEDRTLVNARCIKALSENIDPMYRAFDNFPKRDDIRGECCIDNDQFSLQDGPFPGIL